MQPFGFIKLAFTNTLLGHALTDDIDQRWEIKQLEKVTSFGDTVLQKKTTTLFFGYNFGKWTPIFTILSLLDFAWTFLHICYRDLHLTLDVLLHYLAKSENLIYSCFKNYPFLFSYFFLKRQSFAIKFYAKNISL